MFPSVGLISLIMTEIQHLYWLVLCVYLTQAEVITEKGASVEKNASMRNSYKAFSQLVIKARRGGGTQPTVSGAVPGLVVLRSVRKQTEQARGSKLVRNIPPWLLHQLLLPDLCEFQS